jgi:hypothetical protein
VIDLRWLSDLEVMVTFKRPVPARKSSKAASKKANEA